MEGSPHDAIVFLLESLAYMSFIINTEFSVSTEVLHSLLG